MTKLYAYSFNTENKIMKAAEVDVNETEKQYSVDKGGSSLPFLRKHKMLKSEIGKIDNSFYTLTVYLTERDGLKARQIILDYIKTRLEEHEKQVTRYRGCVNALTGGGVDV